MDWKNIKVISIYESRMVVRSFVFWVLMLAVIGGINFLLWKTLCHFYSASWSWLMHCQSFSFPLVSAYLYNIVQALVLFFVSAEVFTREQQRGPLEALHVRPAGNRELLLGKALGMIRVFLAVGLCSMLVSAGINLWGSVAPFSPWYYLYYFLTLTLPSLVFFTGFSLWVSWLTRSRGTSLAILAGFLYLSAVVLPGILGGLLDFTGSGLSNVFSVATGHVDGRTYALHRLAYLLAGAGFLCWTVRLHRRLPNNRGGVNACLGVGAGLVLAGALVLCVPLSSRLAEGKVREAYRKAFRRHGGETHFRVTRHDITVEQQGGSIRGTSELTLRNTGGQSRERLVLYLNPGFTVEGIEESGRSLSFRRDGQVLLVDRSLAAGDSVRLRLRYGGELDERVAYLELGDEAYHDTKRGNNFFHLGRRHALVGDDALVLVPELLWYPVAVSPVNPVSPVLTGRDYTLYRLRVVRPRQRVILSQGDGVRRGDTVEFFPPRPLEGLTLCGGDYEKKSVKLAGLQVEWYHFPGNDFITPLFTGIDTTKFLHEINRNIIYWIYGINGIIPNAPTHFSEVILRRDWYSETEQRLQIIEAPLPFVSHYRSWKGRSEYVQPGMLFTGEHGMGMYIPKYNYSNPSLPKEKDALKWVVTAPFSIRYLSKISNSFLYSLKLYEPYTGSTVSTNPYNALTLFAEPSMTLSHPAADLMLKFFMIQQGGKTDNLLKEQLHNSRLRAYTYLQNHRLNEALQDETLSSNVLQHIIDFETRDLIMRVQTYHPVDEFTDFLRSFYTSHYGEIPLDTFVIAVQKTFGFDFKHLLQEWEAKTLTSYRIQNLKVEFVEFGVHMLRFRIQNVSTHSGQVIVFDRRSSSVYKTHTIKIQPGECKQVSLQMMSSRPYLYLGISRNIPFLFELSSTQHTTDTTTGIWDIAPSEFEGRTEEIVVDNEDSGFRLIIPGDKLLRRYLVKELPYGESWGGSPPVMQRWNRIFSEYYQGDIIRSAHVKTEGTGSFKAEWKANIPTTGTYEILVWCPVTKIPQSPQYYTVGNNEQIFDRILLPWEAGQWTSLGEFDLEKGTSTVVLDDQLPKEKKVGYPSWWKRRIIADAVKWVKIK